MLHHLHKISNDKIINAMMIETQSAKSARHRANKEQCASLCCIGTVETVFRWSVRASSRLTAYLHLYVAYLVVVGGLLEPRAL